MLRLTDRLPVVTLDSQIVFGNLYSSRYENLSDMKIFQNTIKQFCSILISSKSFGVTFALLLTQHSKFNQPSIQYQQFEFQGTLDIWIFYFSEYDQSTDHSTMKPYPYVTSGNQIQFSRCHDEELMSARGLLYSFQNFNNFNLFTETLYVFRIDLSQCVT